MHKCKCGQPVQAGYHCRTCWEKWQRQIIKEDYIEDVAEAHMAANHKLYYGEE